MAHPGGARLARYDCQRVQREGRRTRGWLAAIVEASGLADEGTIRRSPCPGVIVSNTGTLETLSSGRAFVRGDSPLFAEVLIKPATVAHVHAAPQGCAPDDESAWAAANQWHFFSDSASFP